MAIDKLILGTVQMGLSYGINNAEGQISLSESLDILRKGYESGLRILDTAEAYGIAHQIIRQYHQAFPDGKYEVITKLPHVINDDILTKVNTYLTDLKVEQLHVLLFHSYKSYVDNQHQMKQLVNLKSNGFIKHLGVSVYTNSEIEDVINDEDVDVIQFPYNVFDNLNLRSEVLKKAKDKGKIVHTRSSFLQGLFFTNPDSDKKIVKLLAKELDQLRELAKLNGLSMQRMALDYCLQNSLIDNVLIGIDSLAQLNSNLADAKTTINEEVISQLNAINIQNSDLLNPSLWETL